MFSIFYFLFDSISTSIQPLFSLLIHKKNLLWISMPINHYPSIGMLDCYCGCSVITEQWLSTTLFGGLIVRKIYRLYQELSLPDCFGRADWVPFLADRTETNHKHFTEKQSEKNFIVRKSKEWHINSCWKTAILRKRWQLKEINTTNNWEIFSQYDLFYYKDNYDFFSIQFWRTSKSFIFLNEVCSNSILFYWIYSIKCVAISIDANWRMREIENSLGTIRKWNINPDNGRITRI